MVHISLFQEMTEYFRTRVCVCMYVYECVCECVCVSAVQQNKC